MPITSWSGIEYFCTLFPQTNASADLLVISVFVILIGKLRPCFCDWKLVTSKDFRYHGYFLCIVRSVSVEKLSSLELPSHVTTLLAAPTGHCFVCDSSYFTAVFLQEESANTALRITSAEIFQGLRDTTCSFAFCCCSRSCLDEVSRLHDIPD